MTIEELEAKLETATRERDKFQALAELGDGYTRERDEARNEVERLRDELSRRELERWNWEQSCAHRTAERDEACERADRVTAEVEMLRGVGCCESDKLDEPPSGPCGVCRKCAYRRGAEAMREAAARELDQLLTKKKATAIWVGPDDIRALPIPEEP